MITKIENIRNEFLFKQYKDMVDSMYEEIGSAKWGVRTRIKTKKIFKSQKRETKNWKGS